MTRPPKNRPYGWWTFLILVLLSALVPATYYLKPHIQRWQWISALTSTDSASREQALNYLIRHVANDARLQRSAIKQLRVEDELNFRQIVNALDNAGLWERDVVGDQPWLRWLNGLSLSGEPEARIMAGQLTADLVDRVDDRRILALLQRLAGDEQADVRYNALISLGEMAGAARKTQDHYLAAIATLTEDHQPTIARHAWMIFTLLQPDSGLTANWQTAPPAVAEVILWAALRSNPDSPAPAIEALSHDTHRLAAIYALSQSNTPQAQAALTAIAQTPPEQVTLENHVAVWRSVLAVRDVEAVLRWKALTRDDDLIKPIALSACFRVGTETDESDDLRLLASLEGASPAPGKTFDVAITREMPLLTRAMAVRVNRNATPDQLRPLLESSDATLRDLACVIAAERFDAATLEPFIRELIVDYDDDAKMSGAILCGLTGLETQRLRERTAVEDIWAVATIQKLGQWMAGDDTALNTEVATLLARRDLPTTTILLAMLHRHEPVALDQLLTPRGDANVDLMSLLDQSRWWLVLSRYLPDDAPPLWVWADRDLVQFQIEVLRDWYLVNRYRLFKQDRF